MDALETWKDVPGHEGVYRVSDHGRVASVERKVFVQRKNGSAFYHTVKGRILRQATDRYGYRVVAIESRPVTVHKLVMLAFKGPRPAGKQVAHGRDDKLDNRPGNLRYATPVENIKDRDQNGGTRKGDAHGRSKIKEADWPAIVALRGVLSQSQVGGIYGLSQARISKIQLTKGHQAMPDI